MVHSSSTADMIDRFLSDVRNRQFGVPEDVPGWLVRRASVSDIEDRIAFVIAESKATETAPFILSKGAECVIAVTAGSVAVEGNARTIEADGFWTIHASEGRQIQAMAERTSFICMFFKTRGDDGRPGVDAQSADGPGPDCQRA